MHVTWGKNVLMLLEMRGSHTCISAHIRQNLAHLADSSQATKHVSLESLFPITIQKIS